MRYIFQEDDDFRVFQIEEQRYHILKKDKESTWENEISGSISSSVSCITDRPGSGPGQSECSSSACVKIAHIVMNTLGAGSTKEITKNFENWSTLITQYSLFIFTTVTIQTWEG